MSTLMKKNGLTRTSNLLDDLFDDNFFGLSNWTQEGGSLPKVNIYDNDDIYTVEMAIPGMKKEDFDIELEHDLLTIKAKRNTENEETNTHYTRREFSYESFQRSFHLPNTVDSTRITANYTDGILRMEIPKKDEAKGKASRRIDIS